MEYLLVFENDKPLFAKKRIRVLASFIDYSIFIAIFFILSFNYGEKQISDDNSVVYQLNGFPAFVCFLFWLILIPVIEGWKGQTTGKMFCKIQAVQKGYEKNYFMQCTVRYLFDIIDHLPFGDIIALLVASNNPLKQRVGDLVAKRIVIQK